MKAAAAYPGTPCSSPGQRGLLGTLPGKPARSQDVIRVRPVQGPEPAVGTGCWFQPHHCGLAHEVTFQSPPLPASGRGAAQDPSGAGAHGGRIKPLTSMPVGCPGCNLARRSPAHHQTGSQSHCRILVRPIAPCPVAPHLTLWLVSFREAAVCKHLGICREPHTPHQVRDPGALGLYLARSRCFWTRAA